MTTVQPASASVMAAVLPPGPLPMMTALPLPAIGPLPRHGFGRHPELGYQVGDHTGRHVHVDAVGVGDLGRGVTPRLAVSLELDLRPPDEVLVPPVLGYRVH